MPRTVLNGKESAPTPPLGELTTAIHINVADIPDQVRDTLAAATMDLLQSILSQPGGRERLEAKKLELAAKGKL